jgi:hypothetical protein
MRLREAAIVHLALLMVEAGNVTRPNIIILLADDIGKTDYLY